MNYMFANCQYLASFPDISKWNLDNLVEYKGIFQNCKLFKHPELKSNKNKNKNNNDGWMII